MCSQGSRPAGPRSSQDPRHSEFSARLGEAMYSAIAQALCFLCAVSPQASTSDIAAMRASAQPGACAHTANTSSSNFYMGLISALAMRGNNRLSLYSIWRINIGRCSDSSDSGSVACKYGTVSRLMRRRWQQGWGQGGRAQGCSQTCSSTASQ